MKILAIKLRAMGDVILFIPAIRTLKKAYPSASIKVLSEKEPAEILKGIPYIDEIFSFDRVNSSLQDHLELIRKLRKEKFDIAIDFFGNPRSAFLCFLSGAKKRIGFDFRFRRFFYNTVVQRDRTPKYNALVQLELLKPLGIESIDIKPEIFLTSEERNFARKFIKSLGWDKISQSAIRNPQLIGFYPGGAWDSKRWLVDYFRELALKLVRKNKKVLVLWGPGNRELAEKIIPEGIKKSIALIPQCNIREMSAIIEKLELLITNDATPKHLAVALGVPTITFFGPTDYRAWNPPEGFGKHFVLRSALFCSPCEKLFCSHKMCMKSILPEDVLGLESGVRSQKPKVKS